MKTFTNTAWNGLIKTKKENFELTRHQYYTNGFTDVFFPDWNGFYFIVPEIHVFNIQQKDKQTIYIRSINPETPILKDKHELILEDIELIYETCGCTPDQARRALLINNGEIADAIGWVNNNPELETS